MTLTFTSSPPTNGARAPITSTADRAGDASTTTTAVDGEALILARRRGAHHYEKMVDQLRAVGATDAEITQAVADAPGVISPGKLLPAARGQRRATAELAEHATEIRRLREQVLEDVIEIGNRLTECKKLCAHGQWLSWLEREFGWSDRTALNFIHIYEFKQSKSENFSDLSLPISALYLLAAPSTPEADKTEVIARARAGESLPVAKVKSTIAAHRKSAKDTTASVAKSSAAIDKIPPADEQTPGAAGNDVDAELSAKARMLAYASDEADPVATEITKPVPAENVPTKPSAKTKAASARVRKRKRKISRWVQDAINDLYQVMSAVADEPYLVDPDDLEELLAKALEFVDLVQGARAKQASGGGQ